MSSGITHGTVGIGLGVLLATTERAPLVGGLDEIALAALGALAPDVDRRSSLLGRLVPDRLMPTEEWRTEGGEVRSCRRLGPFRLDHHGPTHSIFTGVLLALPWVLAGHPELARAQLAGWLSHLAADGASKQALLWPLSLVLPYWLRWIRLIPAALWRPASERFVQGAAAGLVLLGLLGVRGL